MMTQVYCTCVCLNYPTEHGNAASQYASGLHHDLQVAYSRLVRKKKCGKEGTLRVDVTRVFLPRPATPHFREIEVEHTQGQHDTPKHCHKYIYYSKRRRAGEPRARISDLTHMLHPPAASSSHQHIITWLERAQQAPSDVT
jgi:hypothetical protein